ncbi:MAG TPA: 4-hydroxy-tetrahydrodipicolinate synthase [Candidatus Binataceae bacterium]|nr:4-hydroxy-tetrahydrodipicolinate synthase [Candidatus Binataceae bacterium]
MTGNDCDCRDNSIPFKTNTRPGSSKHLLSKRVFSGCFTALITPFFHERFDEQAFQALVAWQIKEGIDGLVPCGTTGESPTLSHKEHMRVTESCIEVARGRVPIIAGTGSNSTEETIDFARHAESAGADAQLVVTPYYNKPTQEGLYRHFKAVHDNSGLPIIIYNIPGRCVVDMSVETMAELAKLPRVIGVKDATGDLARPMHTRAAIGASFSLLSGDDATALAFLAQGGDGLVSVCSNIAPKLCRAMQTAWQSGAIDEAQRINQLLAPLSRALFLETNPSPVKYAASLLGLCSGDVRLPLCEITEFTKSKVREAMVRAALLGSECFSSELSKG